jgi:ribosomal protein L7/L12
MREGKKIEAIKEYRTITNAGLKEAKDAVEAPGFLDDPPSLFRTGAAEPESAAATPGADADPQVIGFVRAGQLINAIKRYRELTGLGLKESKDAIDALSLKIR